MLKLIFKFMVLGLWVSSAVAALPIGRVIYIKGPATFAGQTVNVNQELASNGSITTGSNSVVKIYIALWQSTIVLGAHSSMELNLENAARPGDAPVVYSLEKGFCRWISDPGAKDNSKRGVHTKTASIGARAGDFIVKENPLLSESEVVVFDGEVVMVSKLDNPSEASVKKGQWGGIGGRFGQKSIRQLDLPPVVIEEFHKLLPDNKTVKKP